MGFLNEDILAGEILPVLLGLSSEAVATARRLHERYHVISHVFCEHVPLPMRVSLCMKFHTVPHPSGDRLILEALEDFFRLYEKADVMLYLIPCTEQYTRLVWNHRADLESRFVIADRGEMGRVWFGEEIKKEDRK